MSNYSLTKYDKIHYYQNVIENPYELLEMIEDSDKKSTETSIITKWKEWESSDSEFVFGYQKKINQYVDKTLHDPILVNIVNSLTNAITTCSENYGQENNLNIGYLTPISISKYTVGKWMGPHVDSYNDERSPILSIVLYLNDNYEGGELNFPNQDVCIKPSAGSLIAFPSVEPYFHESKKIISGIKYMSPGFWFKELTP
jgi:Rps23 Pro-64 3,4-dihydroxylase Tpa1-like proline 4-hydroxylase